MEKQIDRGTAIPSENIVGLEYYERNESAHKTQYAEYKGNSVGEIDFAAKEYRIGDGHWEYHPKGLSFADFSSKVELYIKNNFKDVEFKNERNKMDLMDKDGDHIPDHIDGTHSPEAHITQSDVKERAYIKLVVTEDQCSRLDEANFKYSRAKDTVNGKIGIRFKTELKQEFERIINPQTQIKGR